MRWLHSGSPTGGLYLRTGLAGMCFRFQAAFGIGGRLKGYLKNKRRQGCGMHARPAPVAAYSDMAG